MQRMPAYVIISLVFMVLIGIGLAYSYFFYPFDHPVECFIKARTGKDCPTCGFSRAFSFYMHGRITEGRTFNALSLPVFLFFMIQLLWRAGITVHYFITKRILPERVFKTDVIISISLFLLAFLPVIFKF